jgi:signal transduction histidine kinase
MITGAIPVDLSAVVANASDRLRALVGSGVELQLNLEPGGLWVAADAGHIEQILLNLITNARDATPRGGTVTVETSRVHIGQDFLERKVRGSPCGEFLPSSEGNYARLVVRDTGIGMDLATQAKVFLPFFTAKEVGKGAGLGLSITYGMVKANYGGILVESELGRGSSFVVYLPEAPAPVSLPERL